MLRCAAFYIPIMQVLIMFNICIVYFYFNVDYFLLIKIFIENKISGSWESFPNDIDEYLMLLLTILHQHI